MNVPIKTWNEVCRYNIVVGLQANKNTVKYIETAATSLVTVIRRNKMYA